MSSLVSVFIVGIEIILPHTDNLININQNRVYFILAMLALLGIISLIGQKVMTCAFKYMPAGKLAPYFYISVPLFSIVDWLIWKQTLTGNTIVGFFLVVIGVLVLSKEQGNIKKECLELN